MPRNNNKGKAAAAKSAPAGSSVAAAGSAIPAITHSRSVVSLGTAMLVSSGYTPLPPSRAARRAHKRFSSGPSELTQPLHEFATAWASRSDGCAAVREAGLVERHDGDEPKQQQQQQQQTRVNVNELLNMRRWALELVSRPLDKASAHDVAVLRGLLVGSTTVDRGVVDSAPLQSVAAGAAAASGKTASNKKATAAVIDLHTCSRATLFEAANRQIATVLDPFLRKHGWLPSEEQQS